MSHFPSSPLYINPLSEVEIVDRETLAKRLMVSDTTIIRLERLGKIPVIKVGNCTRYNWRSVLAALEQSTQITA